MLFDAPLGYTKLPAMARRVSAAECDVPWSTRCCPGARRVARIARRSSCVPFVLLGAWLAALLCKPCWPRRCCLRDAESGLAACFRLARACPPPCRCLGPRCAAGMLGRAWCSGPLGSTRRAAMHVALAAAAAFAAFVRACCAVWLGCVLPACPCLRSGARLPGVVRRACVCSWSESVLAVHWAAARRLAMRALGQPPSSRSCDPDALASHCFAACSLRGAAASWWGAVLVFYLVASERCVACLSVVRLRA